MQSLAAVAERLAIVQNPHAGSAPDRRELVAALEKAGIRADVYAVPGPRDRDSLRRLASDYDVLVAAGGDGTVSSVAAAAADAGRILGVLPTGTLNHFARDAGIPLRLEAAADLLVHGRPAPVDLGVVNGVPFLNNASVGAYPGMVWRRERARMRGMPRPLAATIAVLDTWLELEMMTARLRVDGRDVVRCSPFVVIGNGEYQIQGLRLGGRRTLTGGVLSLYVAPDLGRVDALALPVLALMGRLERHEKFETWTARDITFEAAGRDLRVAVDGEIRRLTLPLRLSVRPRALQVIVPAGGGA